MILKVGIEIFDNRFVDSLSDNWSMKDVMKGEVGNVHYLFGKGLWNGWIVFVFIREGLG